MDGSAIELKKKQLQDIMAAEKLRQSYDEQHDEKVCDVKQLIIVFKLTYLPTVAFNICCPRDCVSRHNGGTRGSPIMPKDAVSRTANVECNGGHKWVKHKQAIYRLDTAVPTVAWWKGVYKSKGILKFLLHLLAETVAGDPLSEEFYSTAGVYWKL